VCGLVVAGVATTATSAAAAVAPALVTVTNAGAPANEATAQDGISVSSHGTLVAFVSASPGLVADDTNGVRDVFVRNLDTGVTTRVSAGPNGEANGASSNARISADGRYVVFTSQATNLVDGDTNGVADVFLRDLVAGTTVRLSVSAAGAQANGVSGGAASGISADGGVVTFCSAASNLVDGDTNGARDVFAWTRGGGLERVSVGSDGSQTSAGASDASALSADGRWVAFASTAPNLVQDDTNLAADVFVHDRVSGATVRASVTSAGGQSPSASALQPGALSANGQVVVFDTAASLVAGDTGGTDVYARDLAAGTTERISVTSAGGAANGNSSTASISADGRYVVFQSSATNLDPADTGGDQDIFVRDRAAGATRLVTTTAQATQTSQTAAISSDARSVAAATTAGDLVAGDAARSFGQGWDVIRFGSPFDVVVDVTPPRISCAQDDGAWHAANVVLQCTAADAGTGLADPSQASFTLSTSVADGAETADAATGSARVCDVAGNCADAGPLTGIHVDLAVPAITVTAPADGATVTAGDPLTASYSCSDAGSGIASCAGPVASGASLDTAAPGSYTFTVTAVDAAGNTASAAVTYVVAAAGDPGGGGTGTTGGTGGQDDGHDHHHHHDRGRHRGHDHHGWGWHRHHGGDGRHRDCRRAR
jgi:Tol biopolymer transport system component